MKTCTVEGCTNAYKASGYCAKHYYANRSAKLKVSGLACTVDGCDRRLLAAGLCRGHYARKMRKVPIDTPLAPVLAPTLFVRCSLPREAVEKLRSEAERLGTTPQELQSIYLLRALGFQR